MQWQPAFFIRSFGLETGELGTWFAVIYGLGGFLGTYLGGELASRHAANNERLQLSAIAIAYTLVFGVVLGRHLSLPQSLSRVCAVGARRDRQRRGQRSAVRHHSDAGAPNACARMSIAIIYLFANLIGMGLGPLAAGVLSDALRPWSARNLCAMRCSSCRPGYVWCGLAPVAREPDRAGGSREGERTGRAGFAGGPHCRRSAIGRPDSSINGLTPEHWGAS